MPSPFTKTPSLPAGHGLINIDLLQPSKPSLTTLTYSYPLKLVTHTRPSASTSALLIFLLTYGGGLVAGDIISLTINLAAHTRLALVTQGSTKIFKVPSTVSTSGSNIVTKQHLDVHIGEDAALCYLPDPSQPFESSVYEQRQVFTVSKGASLCLLDWVNEGRRARGESWAFNRWTGRNEIFLEQGSDPGNSKRRLLLRDAIILDGSTAGKLASSMDGMGVVGTLILHGPLFKSLGQHFMSEFAKVPRIGGRNWSTAGESAELASPAERSRDERLQQERKDGLLWTAANVRGMVLVKFGAHEVEGARNWLGRLLKEEGSVLSEFGDQALLCIK